MRIKNKKITFFKASIITCLLLLTAGSTLTQATPSSDPTEQATQYIFEQLPYDPDELLVYIWGPVAAGDSIQSTKQHLFDIPEPGFVMYIDLYPMANLFHPVQYIYLSETKEKLYFFDAETPPQNFFDYQLVETSFGKKFITIENRIAPLPETNVPAQMSSSRDTRYAVLMNGGYGAGSNHVRYWNDLSNIYITLNHVYDFPDENIIVLCSDGLNPAPDQSNGQNSDPDLDGDGDDDIMYSCVLSNVDMVFTNLANNFSAGYKLFIFTTDHGSSISGWSVLQNLWNAEELVDAHFRDLLDLFPPCEILCTFEPCFSGGFLDDVVVPPGPVVASSACRHDEYSWASSNLLYDEYVFHWTAAMKGEDAFGNPVDADLNQDGKITMDEAYIYAEAHDVQPESPQYDEYPEGIGSELSLWISNPPPENLKTPSGPDEGVAGKEYSFSTSATDPDSEDIYYRFDWGDGNMSDWLGPFPSGATCSDSYTWMIDGVYEIRAKAKDIAGSESAWSEPHEITIYALPILEIRTIEAGKGRLSANIKNIGTVNVTNMNYSITFEGGLILLGKQTTGVLPRLNVNVVADIHSKFIFGFGKPRITVRLESQEQVFEKTVNATVMLFFILDII